ncbi:hypothetical protein BA724_04480 [Domibacillus iocasae]|uniref:SHOCT domain-containing protein n=2 Tax=Domibacillus iocasae TaxID=1714016 RepID=A0A1E7DQ98_9BACI|nr:hypothetical protein BA724_04480 [Domibacillus iocasae]
MHTYEFKHGGKTTVTIDSDFIRIDRKGLFNKSSGLKGEKSLKLDMITSVQLIPASAIKGGFLQFSIPGSKDVKGIYMSADENTVMFSKKEQHMAEEVKGIVEGKIQRKEAAVSSPNSSSLSVADELKKLAELKDAGILSQEEFDAQKKLLL